jgi:hypothetical protein
MPVPYERMMFEGRNLRVGMDSRKRLRNICNVLRLGHGVTLALKHWPIQLASSAHCNWKVGETRQAGYLNSCVLLFKMGFTVLSPRVQEDR